MDEKGLIEKAQTWVVENGADFVVNLIIFIGILIIGSFVIKTILKVLKTAMKKSPKMSEMLDNFIVSISSKILWVILLMMALPRLGVDVGPMIAGLGVGGFIIGFAFQETLGNLAAGVMIMLNQPFTIGHFVEVGGCAGVIKEINIMATTLNTPDNKRVTMPNSQVWGSSIINYSVEPTRRVDLVAGISYSGDMDKAIGLLKDLLKNHDLVLNDPAPTIGVVELADSSVNLVVRPWVKTDDYWGVYFDVTQKIKEVFDKEGIEIPFPQMDVHIQQMPKVD